MTTPIYDFLLNYSSSNFLRLHMPAHKGIVSDNLLSKIYPLDITEITGADSLFEADGIISESEKNASRLFKTSATFYSANGSTLCIQTMLALMKEENRSVIAVRNTHRSFLNACALLDLDVTWIYPKYQDNSILSGEIDLTELEFTLKSSSKPSCVYITSPDYLGKIADIEAIAKICHHYNSPLLVDNAHGACLAFTDPIMHPIALGADLCCDSAHKMLPALTGSAYLHLSNSIYTAKVKDTMALFASTSPSYLILSSLDLCNKYIETNIQADLKNVTGLLNAMKKRLAPFYSFYENGEPLHLTIMANNSGLYGFQLAEILREHKIECEYADSQYVVLLFSPINTQTDIEYLENVLKNIPMPRIIIRSEPIQFPKPQKAMSIRKACFSSYEEIPIEKALGRVCASLKVPCPPAVPIAISGEIISDECINIFKRYGIITVNVVK